MESIGTDTYYTLPTLLQSESTCSPPLLSARQLLLFLSFPSSHWSLAICLSSLPALFLCLICIITASWLNLVKLSFGTAGAAGGGRFAGSCNRYWGAMGPLWKSSSIKTRSSELLCSAKALMSCDFFFLFFTLLANFLSGFSGVKL